jgi:hypothetical protein
MPPLENLGPVSCDTHLRLALHMDRWSAISGQFEPPLSPNICAIAAVYVTKRDANSRGIINHDTGLSGGADVVPIVVGASPAMNSTVHELDI